MAQRWGSLAESVPQSQRAVLQLKGRVSELEAELAEQRHLRQQAADDSEFLRAELDELKKKREDTEKAQRSLTEIESESVGLRLTVGAEESGEARGKDGAERQSPSRASFPRATSKDLRVASPRGGWEPSRWRAPWAQNVGTGIRR